MNKELEESLSNSYLNIRIIRHAQKGEDGLLTEEGKSAAKAFGQKLESAGNIVIYTSDITRAIQTGSIILNNISKTNQNQPNIDSLLSEIPYEDLRLSELGLSGGKWLYLEPGDSLLPSSKAMAGKIAKFILDTIDNRQTTLGLKNLEIIAVSHVPPIMCLVAHCLAKSLNKTRISEEILEEIRTITHHDFIPTLEGIMVSTLPNDSNHILISMGDLSIVSNVDFLSELVDVHSQETNI